MFKPSVLILGGLGQDGSRHLITHLLSSNSSSIASTTSTTVQPSFVRIVDKYLIIPQADPMPSTVYLDKKTQQALRAAAQRGEAQYVQGNLLTQVTRAQAFTHPDGAGKGFDVVFDFTGESDFDASEAVHVERTLKLAIALGQTAAESNVGVYVKVLPSQVKVTKGKVGDVGSGIAEPWGIRAQWHHEAARSLGQVSGLNLICIRPALFYGHATLTGITPRALIGELYRHRGERLDFLWKESLQVNTIHEQDFCTAALHVALWGHQQTRRELLDFAGESFVSTLKADNMVKNVTGAARKDKDVQIAVFETVDDSDTTQQDLANIIAKVIGVDCGFHNSIVSSFAKMNMEDVLEDVNEKHIEGWGELLTASDPPISSTTPLSPNTPADLLQPFPIAFTNRKLKSIGWSPKHKLEPSVLENTIRSFKEEQIWPSAKPKSRKK
ncbi:hypothetical protein OIO90_000672 [Microbotryomycetes sp. JL221]|nr:hypothetical protein OIO90_000672 [Microbotryomycetes sp. JL221]